MSTEREWNGFLISSGNRVAVETCRQSKGLILLTGPSGSGKTHLLRTLAENPSSERPCQYMTCAAWIDELIYQIAADQRVQWLRELSQKDLLIDDGAVLAGKKSIQQELSLLAGWIAAADGRMILAADSLFGHTPYRRAVLLKPDRDLRRRYLEAFCEKEQMTLSAREKQRYLYRCRGDLRRLRGLLLTQSAWDRLQDPQKRPMAPEEYEERRREDE